jgi:hypothetical protein
MIKTVRNAVSKLNDEEHLDLLDKE